MVGRKEETDEVGDQGKRKEEGLEERSAGICRKDNSEKQN